MLTKSKPDDAKKFFAQAQVDADRRWKFYQYMAQPTPKPAAISTTIPASSTEA